MFVAAAKAVFCLFPPMPPALRGKCTLYNMYHPAPAVKRGHLGNIKTNRFITLSGVLEIIFRGADEPALLGRGHGRSRCGQRVGAAGLDLTEHQCAVCPDLFQLPVDGLGIGRYKGEPGGRSGGRCHTGSDESYAADYMSGYEMTGGGSFADIFPAADESQ